MTAVSAIDLTTYKQIVILTGAGISVASGLPTYRGAGGLWDEVDVANHATAAAIAADPVPVWGFFGEIRRQIAAALPNAGHIAIVQAEARLRKDQKLTVLTQNVDGLHSLAGSTNVVELHGTLRRNRCTRCDYEASEDLASSPVDCPRCPACSALLRPAVVLFDEPLPVDAEWSAKKALRCCDLFVAIGTSGSVSPASNFVRAAEYAGARTVYVNLELMKPHNPAFREILLGRGEEILPRLFASS